MKLINIKKSFISKQGETINYDYDVPQYENCDEMLSELSKNAVFQLAQRMLTTDAGNKARATAKSECGDTPKMTLEEKAANNAKNKKYRALLAALKDNPELLAQLEASL